MVLPARGTPGSQINWVQAIRSLSPDPDRPELVAGWTTAFVVIIVLFLHWIDAIAGWIATMIVSMLLLLANIFVMITLQEYEDRMAREPTDVAKTLNPVRYGITALRVLLVLQYLMLRSWWFAILVPLPLAAYDFTPFATKQIDATRLWKDVAALKTESKFRLAGDMVAFFVIMFFMMYQLIFNIR
jgi:hypothetical protein